MCKPWQNNMLDITTHDVYINEDLDMVNHFIERYGENSYEIGRVDALEEVRAYFNSFNPSNINVDIETWQMGINNYINRMIKEENE